MKNDIRIPRNDLFTKYESFLFIEGQTGLPPDVKEVYEYLHDLSLEVWVIEDVFQKTERIKAIPFLNPSVIIFQTTMLDRDKINYIYKYLEDSLYRPKEIWQCTFDERTFLDTKKYDVYNFRLDEELGIILNKL